MINGIVGGQPCSTCAKRGHPNICFFADDTAEPAQASRKRNHGGAEHTPAQETAHTEPPSLQTPTRSQTKDTPLSLESSNTTIVGDLSAENFVRNRLEPQNELLAHQIRPGLGLGLGNTLRGQRSTPAPQELLTAAPRRREVLRYVASTYCKLPGFVVSYESSTLDSSLHFGGTSCHSTPLYLTSMLSNSSCSTFLTMLKQSREAVRRQQHNQTKDALLKYLSSLRL